MKKINGNLFISLSLFILGFIDNFLYWVLIICVCLFYICRLFGYGMGIHLLQSDDPESMPKKTEINPKDNHISFQVILDLRTLCVCVFVCLVYGLICSSYQILWQRFGFAKYGDPLMILLTGPWIKYFLLFFFSFLISFLEKGFWVRWFDLILLYC